MDKDMGKGQVKLSHSIYNLIRLYVKIWRFDKFYVMIGIAATLLLSLKPFSGLLFIKLIIEELSNGENMQTAIVYVLLMVSINGLLSLLEDAYKRYDDLKIETIKANFLGEIELLTMAIPYDQLHESKTMDQHAKTLEIFHPTQAAYMDMRNSILIFKSLLSFLLQLIGLTYILLSLHWFAVVGLIIACILSIGVDAIAADKEFKVWDISLVHFGRKVGYLQNICIDKEHAKELRNYSLAGWITRKMKRITEITMKEVHGMVRTFTITSAISNTLMVIVKTLLYLYILNLAVRGVISKADILVYFNTIGLVITVLLSISYCVLLLYKSGLFTSAYFGYLEENKRYKPGGEANSTLPISVRSESCCIVVDDVWFKYPGNTDYTLRGISLRITANTTTAIVGDNGAGKSTLIKLILRLYTPERGRILLNGINIEEIPRSEYYRLVTAVFQDFNILNYSFVENIVFDKEYSDEELYQVISDLGMETTVEGLPRSYGTILGKMFDESGVELSAGQAQKIAIARALIKKSQVIIMDEPTAMLSPVAEYEIYTNLSSLTARQTAIYISHRMSSCKFCNSIIVLQNGKVAEQGSHDELMGMNGIYNRMFTIQAEFYRELQPV
ncbi:ABC transporter ATP-binding protein [Paenibacillus sp. GCM10012306]|uniref:ABC transporter ATP-binding protein n=1 Tax=Paenibacillus sp. GCM10012306 TaxID=3317342 RepID=UPI003613148E